MALCAMSGRPRYWARRKHLCATGEALRQCSRNAEAGTTGANIERFFLAPCGAKRLRIVVPGRATQNAKPAISSKPGASVAGVSSIC